MNRFLRLLTITILISGLYTTPAAAQSCGDLVFADVTLTDNLSCDSSFYALEVRADNITINLNGFTISGKGVSHGIIVGGYNNVTIRDGQIQGFPLAVNTTNTQGLTVTGIEFYRVGSGVVVSSGVFADIYSNQFLKTTAPAISVVNYVAGQHSNAYISDNEFYRARVGIQVCGQNADNVLIYNNNIDHSTDYGIHLLHSKNNIIQGNTITNAGNIALRLDDTTNTTMIGNSLRDGSIGLGIYGNAGGSGCLAGGAPGSYSNQFESNHSIGFNIGVSLGTGGPIEYVVGNNINGNKIYDDNIGIWFNSDTSFNDGTGNAYSGTTTPIVDSGSSNIY